MKLFDGKSNRVIVPSVLLVTTNVGFTWNAIPSGSEVIATFCTTVPLRSRIVMRNTGARFDRNRKLPLGSKKIPSSNSASDDGSTAKLLDTKLTGSMLTMVQVGVNRQSDST